MGAFLSLINPISTILNKVLPDKSANDAAKAELLQMQLQGDLTAVAQQIQVNIAEAQSKSTFVAGWRPFVGWICGCAFGYSFILQPFAVFLLVAFKVNFDASKLPVINTSEMMPVLLGMLGLAAARTVEKVQGVSGGQ